MPSSRRTALLSSSRTRPGDSARGVRVARVHHLPTDPEPTSRRSHRPAARSRSARSATSANRTSIANGRERGEVPGRYQVADSVARASGRCSCCGCLPTRSVSAAGAASRPKQQPEPGRRRWRSGCGTNSPTTAEPAPGPPGGFDKASESRSRCRSTRRWWSTRSGSTRRLPPGDPHSLAMIATFDRSRLRALIDSQLPSAAAAA